MTDSFLSFSISELLYIVIYVGALIVGIISSQKLRIHPVLTVLLLLTAITAYLGVTTMAGKYLQGFILHEMKYHNFIVLLGVLGAILAIRVLKSLFRIPFAIIHHQLIWIYLLFIIHQFQMHLGTNQGFSYLIYSYPISNISGMVQFGAVKQTASLVPDIFTRSLLFYETITAILAMLIYVYFQPRLHRSSNAYSLALLSFLLLFFISLFGINPAGYPALSERLLGLNLVQWGVALICVLLLAHILSELIDAHRPKREVLKKAPPEHRLLITYLILTFISIQITVLYNPYTLKILILGFFVTSIFMVFHFIKTVHKNYLKYGTVSIILMVCMLFLYASYSESRNLRHSFSDTTLSVPDYPESFTNSNP